MTGIGFLFASDLFCLHPVFFVRIIFFVCILSFLFASDLFCLHPVFFVCSKPFFIALTLVGHRTLLTQITLHFLYNVSENVKKPIILTFFKQFPKFASVPLLNFGVDLKFDHIPLCVYYRRYIMHSLVFLTHFFKSYQKKLWGGGGQLDPSLVQEGLKL